MAISRGVSFRVARIASKDDMVVRLLHCNSMWACFGATIAAVTCIASYLMHRIASDHRRRFVKPTDLGTASDHMPRFVNRLILFVKRLSLWRAKKSHFRPSEENGMKNVDKGR